MRFAYIDSQGKEVGIPTVDALQLRIELGAIVEDTMFFDASSDKWAPAADHEIFRTLSRELESQGAEGGFVAPPPPKVRSRSKAPPLPLLEDKDEDGDEAAAKEKAAKEAAAREKAAKEAAAKKAAEEAAAKEKAAKEAAAKKAAEEAAAKEKAAKEAAAKKAAEEAAAKEKAAKEAAARKAAEEAAAKEKAAAEAAAREKAAKEAAAKKAAEEAAAKAAKEAEEKAAREAEEKAAREAEAAAAGEAAAEEAASRRSPDPFGDLDVAPAPAEADPAPPVVDAGGGLELETSFAEQHSGSDAGVSEDSGMEMERPLSDYSSDEPPGWMEESAPAAKGREPEYENPYAAVAQADAAEAAPAPARVPRSAPARVPDARIRPASRRKEKSNLGGVLVLVVLLGAVGAGGWFGWGALQERRARAAAEQAAQEAEVELPPIPGDLEPRMRELAAAAWAATLDSLAGGADALPDEPDQEWLAGRYLATASDFPSVEGYWNRLRRYVADVRGSEDAVFAAMVDRRLERADLEAEQGRMVRDRALAGFRAARPDRRVHYEGLVAVIDAAAGLHAFLLQNEDRIGYEPAARGMSRDPVLEAVPASPELGEEMWERVGGITEALDAFGTLDRVTTDRLVETLFDRLEGTAVR